jgi:hypothetical protein
VSTAFVGLTDTQRATPTALPQDSGLLGRYYIVRGQIPPANPFLDRNLVLTRVDKTVDFIWPYGGQESPGAGVPNDLFAIRWDGQVYAPVTGVYTFGTYHDDGARLYVDNTLLYDDWNEGQTRKAQNRINLIAGTWYPIRLEFWENVWTAEVQLFWSFPGQAEKIIPSVNLKPDVSTTLAETQPAQPTPSPSRVPSNTPWPPTPAKTASPVPPSTEAAVLSSTPPPIALTSGPLTCQLTMNQNIHVLDGTNLWSQPDAVNGSIIGTLPAGTSVYVINGPAWGLIVETGVAAGWWWEISSESNGASKGWIWEGRIEECN